MIFDSNLTTIDGFFTATNCKHNSQAPNPTDSINRLKGTLNFNGITCTKTYMVCNKQLNSNVNMGSMK